MSLPDSVSNLIDIRTKKGSVAVGHVKQIARIAYMLGLATKNKEAHRPVRRKPPVQHCKSKMTCSYGGKCEYRTVRGLCQERRGHCSEQVTSDVA